MSYMTSGCWSQTRPGVFYTTKLDGTVDAWDLSYKQKVPVLSIQARATCTICLFSLRQHLSMSSEDYLRDNGGDFTCVLWLLLDIHVTGTGNSLVQNRPSVSTNCSFYLVFSNFTCTIWAHSMRP